VNRRIAVALGSLLYAGLDLVVVVAPSVILRSTGTARGIERGYGLDLVVASLVLGVLHAGVSWWSLQDERRTALRRLDAWIAAVVALAVLALSVSLLLPLVLVVFADQHAQLSNAGYPVVGLVTGVLATSMVIAEGARRAMFRWLEGANGAGDAPAAPRREVSRR
jgi:hypothetical protein